MIKYPKTIYLFPMDNQIVWDADNSSPVAEGAQEYVRADIHESTTTELQEEIGHLEDRVISQGKQLREIVNITKGVPVDKIHSTHDAVESVERLQARVAEKCDAPAGWIAPDKYKAACESKMEFFKTIKELREQNEKLQARVAKLVAVAVSVRDDLLLRSEIDSDGTRCVNLSASKWNSFCDVIDDNNSGAFILRRQAEALLKAASMFGGVDFRGVRIGLSELAQGLRNDAAKAEGADDAG